MDTFLLLQVNMHVINSYMTIARLKDLDILE